MTHRILIVFHRIELGQKYAWIGCHDDFNRFISWFYIIKISQKTCWKLKTLTLKKWFQKVILFFFVRDFMVNLWDCNGIHQWWWKMVTLQTLHLYITYTFMMIFSCNFSPTTMFCFFFWYQQACWFHGIKNINNCVFLYGEDKPVVSMGPNRKGWTPPNG